MLFLACCALLLGAIGARAAAAAAQSDVEAAESAIPTTVTIKFGRDHKLDPHNVLMRG